MSLLDLPDEILLLVSFSIEHHGDAVAFAVASRRLYQLADLRLRRKFRRIRIVPNTTTTTALELCIQILKKPHLGRYIRHIEVDWFDRYRSKKRLIRANFPVEDLPLLCQAVRNGGIIDSDSDEEILGVLFPPLDGHYNFASRRPEHTSADLLTALFASLSPGLTSISCSDLGLYTAKVHVGWHEDGLTVQPADNPGSGSYLGRLLQSAGERQGDTDPFQNLRTVRFFSDCDFNKDDRFYAEVDYFQAVNVIRRLPAVESVQFEGSTSSEQHMSVRPPPRSANYHTLAFDHSSPGFSDLKSVLLSTKALRRLTLSLGGRNMAGGHTYPLYLDPFLETLLSYRETLEHLDIDADDVLFLRDMFGERTVYRRNWGGILDEFDEKTYEEEWAEELATSTVGDETRFVASAEKPTQRLSNLHRLKHLGMGKYGLYYLARGTSSDRINPASFLLVDHIPAQIESLRIYGMGQSDPSETREMNLRIDWHVAELMKLKATKLPLLQTVEGVDEWIPNGESVGRPDDDTELLWKRRVELWTDQEEDLLLTEPEDSDDSSE